MLGFWSSDLVVQTALKDLAEFETSSEELFYTES